MHSYKASSMRTYFFKLIKVYISAYNTQYASNIHIEFKEKIMANIL